MLARIAARGAANQTEADYAVPKGLTLRDEIARYFRIGAALFKDFAASPTPSAGAALSLMDGLLSQVFGFTDVEARRDEGQTIALEAKKGRVPVVIVPPSDDLDRASAFLSASHGTELGRRRSAASSLQDWLNHTDQALWGFCTNGDQVRLMRDNASLTRPAFVEVNLRQIFESENFADFAAIWQLFHSTRFGAPGTPVTDCALERWHEAGASEGLVARDRLRDGVETALLAFGNGFLAHPENSSLRTRVTAGELPLPEFFGQLLRLVYRLIFLLVAEDRGLLHPPGASPSAAKLYAEGYSLSALRDRAIRRTAWDQHFDRWEGLLITFAGLAQGQPKIALPALGGLFDNVIPDLERARLSNRALMEAVYRLAWLKDDASLVPVNWRDMETEELGSVYESLLELTPILVDEGRGISFAEGDETKGNQRKTTGSYYTPDSLVQTLLDSALDPVLDRVESESNGKVQGLLGVTVIDPACGSGHFLLAAARRIAARVARARTGGVASAQDYRHALRDVVRSCVHGVDRNPMAIRSSVSLTSKYFARASRTLLTNLSREMTRMQPSISSAATRPNVMDRVRLTSLVARTCCPLRRHWRHRYAQSAICPKTPPAKSLKRRSDSPPRSPSVNFGVGALRRTCTSRRSCYRKRTLLASLEPRWCRRPTMFGGRCPADKCMGHWWVRPARWLIGRAYSTGRSNFQK
jgi:hypothetical protein